MKEMDDKSFDFCKIDVHLKPSDPWEEENTSLASEYCKMKDNCERDEFTPSLSVGEQKIGANQCDVVNGDKGSFGSNPKEEKISNLKSLSKLPKEVEDKPPQGGCELGNLKEKNVMQRDRYSSELLSLLQHDEY